MGNKQKKRRTEGDIILTVLLIAAIGVFCVAGFNLLRIYFEYKQGVDEYNNIAEMAVTENAIESEEGTGQLVDLLDNNTDSAVSYPVPPIAVDFNSLLSVNQDVIGWIYIEALPDINYPVVQGTDNDYYLHRTYKGEDNFAGTIFIDYENSRDFSDCNTLVYGHNMKNGSMFGNLKKFTSDPSIYEASPYFWIFTPTESRRYEIISAYVTAVDSEIYTLFWGPSEDFVDWMKRMKNNSSLATAEQTFALEDKIVTLSTCTGNYSTRYVVQGKLTDIVPVS